MKASFTGWVKKKISSAASRSEDGDTFVLYLLLFPVLFAFFGVSVDMAGVIYTQNTLQSALDTATQSTVSQSKNTTNDTGPVLPYTTSSVKMYNIYDKNRSAASNNPFLACQGKNGLAFATKVAARQITPPSGCGFSVSQISFAPKAIEHGKVVRNVVDFGVQEYSHLMFLHVLGMEYHKYDLKSRAYLTNGQGS